MVRFGTLVTLALACAVTAPGSASAQLSDAALGDGNHGRTTPAARLSPAAASQLLAPSIDLETVVMEESVESPVVAPQERDRSGVPWMVAGGALFVAGAVIGDDGGTLLMIGGAGAGAYGAFVYFGGEL